MLNTVFQRAKEQVTAFSYLLDNEGAMRYQGYDRADGGPRRQQRNADHA